ncbi:glycoside hydrolase family 78 protein [Novipirellula artificiosorum]|uniref:alpha-L-rhamnosidase n=1 Tax=Novipirellula artificiosorum TaxID=2528016 RepID=A0A5C6DW42_9BACT|nr:glycoside hydrolase family 78 protein [Novipirellula artificiosorum]TWU39621.1 Bacterial alpha-L-rhamnosidase [Novipirellula artificiosorum]
MKLRVLTGILLVQLTGCHIAFCEAAMPEHLVVGEGFVEPLGFHDAMPTFSWKLPVGTERQTSYQIEVRDTLAEKTVWDSGWVESDQSVFVPYGGSPLLSRQQLSWRIRFRDQDGNDSDWSAAAEFEMGLLTSKDWNAQWIRSASEVDSDEEKVAYLRREFPVATTIARARLYATARGLYEVYLNGEKVGNDAFTPGWTSYGNRIDTQTYDVTAQLKQGENALGAMLGYGWYAGRIGWQKQRNIYGEVPELLLQLEITFEDGRVQTIASDDAWQATLGGPIVASSIYDGETFDARQSMPGWNEIGFDDSDWSNVATVAKLETPRLTPKPFAPVRMTETLSTQTITEPEPGRFVFDLGQNMVGWPELNLPVEKNETVTIRFAEMLNQDGTMYTDNYRSAKSIDFYTAAESGRITWKPTFTFHGFRYVELSGLPQGSTPTADWVKGLVLHSDLKRTGSFESSHEKLNQLQRNIDWGQRGNFLDIPTDCPQRDERCGWTGDAQAFCPTAMFNYDCHAFWKSWLRSMRDDQFSDGRIPHVIPDILKNRGGSPGWVDAATIIPWQVYLRTSDKEILLENYDMMERLVGWYREHVKGGVVEKVEGFGDWLQPYASDNKGDTPHVVLATLFYANSVQILADSARALGKSSDGDKYGQEAAAAKQAFANHFFDSNGKLQNAPETQTAYILAIAFDLIPAELQTQAANHLVRLIGEADGHLRTGFLGTPFITQVLDQSGHSDVAFSVLFKETYPSWFYSINQGATTMWERWNSYSHTDGFGDVGMNSFNHYAYGAVGQWMYERIAGLSPDPAHPGYKHFFVRPILGGPLTSASAELETGYGKAASGWQHVGDKVELTVTVPPNTTATVVFPDDRPAETLSAGQYRFECKGPSESLR